MVQLIAKEGDMGKEDLYFPPNPKREWMPDEPLILLRRYREGDCEFNFMA